MPKSRVHQSCSLVKFCLSETKKRSKLEDGSIFNGIPHFCIVKNNFDHNMVSYYQSTEQKVGGGRTVLEV